MIVVPDPPHTWDAGEGRALNRTGEKNLERRVRREEREYAEGS